MRRCAGILASILPLLLCMIARPAHAGDGFIRDGKLNLNVMFAYDEPQPETWKPLFDAANALLYNATNGQLQLGTINVVNCGYSKEDMDIWILDDAEGVRSRRRRRWAARAAST